MKTTSVGCLKKAGEADDWARGMISALQAMEGPIYFGLDTEWNIDETRDLTRAISIY